MDVEVHDLILLRHQVGALEIGTKKRASSLMAGTQRSPFKGRGINFEEVRRYQPGDEIRHMDWRVTARTGEPHLKLFQEERERPVIFVVDFTASMLFGTRVAFKSVIAARVATLLAWAALARGDRVGSLIFSDQGHQELRPRGGRSGVLRLTKGLADVHAEAKDGVASNQLGISPFAQALARLSRAARPGSLIFFVSDFRNFDEQAMTYARRMSVHQELMALMVFDPIEANPPPSGRYKVTDGIHYSDLDTTQQDVVTGYRNNFLERRSHIENCCKKLRMGFVPIATNEPLLAVLQSGLHHVAMQRRHA
ncbi:MAG: DUF58 domain-containing protein [Nitrospirae bacterium]|nr:DUF58 domain-containing protein [Nitrospirota bacterium]